MRVFSFILLIFWVIADQALKLYIVNNYVFQETFQTIVPGLLTFTYTLNKGAAWSLFWGQLGFLTVLRFTVAILITLYLFRKSLTGWPRIAFALIAGGAFGNAIDGLLRDGVVDMLILVPLDTVYQAITGSSYPIFNLADVGVVGGALLMVVLSFFTPKKPANPNNVLAQDVSTQDDVVTYYAPQPTVPADAEPKE